MKIFMIILKKIKKIIFFRVIDDESFKVMIPCSLRKNELYYTARLYKKFEYSEIQLFHKNRFLSEDDTNIDCIGNDDKIKIIEILKGVDFSYYDTYLLNHKNEPKIFLIFSINDGKNKNIKCTKDISIEEIIKIFFSENNIPQNKINDFKFLFNGKILNIHDKSTLEQNGIIDCSNILSI